MSFLPNPEDETIIKNARDFYYKENSFHKAIELLDKQLLISQDQNLYYEKAILYLENGNSNLAVEILNLGLDINSKNYLLLQLKVQIALKESVNLVANDAIIALNGTLEILKKCINLFYEDNEKFRVNEGGIEFTKYLLKENELKLIESNVKNLIYSNTVLNEVNNTKVEINKTQNLIINERKNIFELLGLFTALIAFIIVGVNIAKDKPTVDGVIMIAAIGLVLMTFLLGIHMLEFIPRRVNDLWWIILIYLFILFCLPFIPNLIQLINRLFIVN